MEWRLVPNFKKYIVSENGDVVRLYKGGSRIQLKVSITKRGHKVVTMVNDDGHKRGVTLQRVVALAFIPNPEGYGIVKHRDGNISNCKASNLYWAGHKDSDRQIDKIKRLRYETRRTSIKH